MSAPEPPEPPSPLELPASSDASASSEAPPAPPEPEVAGAAGPPGAGEPGPAWRSRLGEGWPLWAAAALVAATLIAVYTLLHPRRPEARLADEGVPAVVSAEEATLQREPSARASAVATLPQGQRVRVRGEATSWLEVSSDAGTGYLPASAVEREADRDARVKRAKTLLALAPVYGVVAEDVEIALAPYPLAARGGTLSQGTVIAIHSVDHSYFAYADKKWGVAYVDSSRVDLVPPDPRAPAIAPEKMRPLKDLTVVDLAAEPPPDEEAGVEGETAPAPAPAVPPEPAPGLLEPATVVSRTDPLYPEAARRAGIEGTVELEVSIDASGKVTDVEVVRGLPLGLSESAAESVRRWTWRPARGPSGPVASRKTVRIRFQLRPDSER